jgi:hypothetical protein
MKLCVVQRWSPPDAPERVAAFFNETSARAYIGKAAGKPLDKPDVFFSLELVDVYDRQEDWVCEHTYGPVCDKCGREA